VKVLTGGLASVAVLGALATGAPAAAQPAPGGSRAAPVARAAQAGPQPDGLPTRWCGERNSPFSAPASGPVFKLVYARPADRPDRFRAAADALQADAAAISRFVAWRSGWSRTVRFAMGTSCGPQYVNIAAVELPRVRRDYLDAEGHPQLNVVADDVVQWLPRATELRNVVVLADTLGDGRVLGAANPTFDDRDVAENEANLPGREAMVFSTDSSLADGLPGPAAFLHELLHTIGAVAPGAPNGSGGGHCTDAYDLMCYDDGRGPALRWVCPPLDWVIGAQIDCGGDDYFNPRPAPGSYLATHWNVYDSHFLGSCLRDLVAACGTDRSFAPREVTDPEPFGQAPPEAEPARAAGRPAFGRQQTASPLRRLRRGRMVGFPLSTVRAKAFHDVDGPRPEPIVAVRSDSLRLPAGRWRLFSCVAAANTTAGITRHATRCMGAGSLRLRRTTQVRPPERNFSFARRGGMPRLAAGWIEVRPAGAGGRPWASSLDRRDPDLLIRPDG
jgi:hypothetical protein